MINGFRGLIMRQGTVKVSTCKFSVRKYILGTFSSIIPERDERGKVIKHVWYVWERTYGMYLNVGSKSVWLGHNTGYIRGSSILQSPGYFQTRAEARSWVRRIKTTSKIDWRD